LEDEEVEVRGRQRVGGGQRVKEDGGSRVACGAALGGAEQTQAAVVEGEHVVIFSQVLGLVYF